MNWMKKSYFQCFQVLIVEIVKILGILNWHSIEDLNDSHRAVKWPELVTLNLIRKVELTIHVPKARLANEWHVNFKCSSRDGKKIIVIFLHQLQMPFQMKWRNTLNFNEIWNQFDVLSNVVRRVVLADFAKVQSYFNWKWCF